ncbi:MAG: dethiobiotin synthetase [Bradymonadia bacterium]|jgi:dethiobiotin synthetase
MINRGASFAFRVVVLGNNTEVGKTWTSTRLLQALRARGLNVAASKPIESGTDLSTPKGVPADARDLAAACGFNDWRRVCRWALAPPIAPAEALEREGIVIRDQDMEDAIAESVSGADIAVVESAGGLWSPLYGERCSIDLLDSCDGALLVVADELGGMNQAILSADAISARFSGPLWVMLNRKDPAAETLGNRKWITRLRPALTVFDCVNTLAEAVQRAPDAKV